MKKQLRLGAVLFASLLSINSKAQSYTESFDDVTTLAGSGWVLNNLSTPVGTAPNWFQGDLPTFPAFSGAGYVAGSYNNVSGANTISNWMISPQTNLINGSTITFYTRTVNTPNYPDRLQVLLSTNGASTNVGATNTSVGDFTTVLLDINPTLTASGYPNTWTQYSATISGLGAPTSGRIAFRYFVTNGGPSGSNSDYIGVDQFSYNDINSTNPDLSVFSVNKEYTVIPLSQITAMNLSGIISNVTVNPATDAQLTVNVYQAPNFTTPIFTNSSGSVAIAANSNSPQINLGTYLPSVVGNYRYEYISTCTGNTATSADTMNFDFEVSSNLYARDNGLVSGNLGIGAGVTGYLGNKFTITTTTEIDSVFAAFNKSGASFGDSTRIEIYDFAAGLPNTKVGSSAAYIFTEADTLAGIDEKIFQMTDLSGNTLVLNPGDYLVTVVEYNQNVEIANTNDIYLVNSMYVNWSTSPAGTWAPVEFFGSPTFNKPFVLRPYLSPVCPVSFSTDVQSACDSFLWIDGNTYNASNNTAQFVLTTVAGCDSIVTLDLVINTTPIGTALNNGDNTITATGGTTYQWINCATNQLIAGETNDTLVPTANGSYAAIVGNGSSCADTTNCVVINDIGIGENATIYAQIYPNPTTDAVSIVFAETSALVTITDMQGKIVQSSQISTAGTISLNKLQAGTYFFEIKTENGINIQRVVKK